MERFENTLWKEYDCRARKQAHTASLRKQHTHNLELACDQITNPGTTPITNLAVNPNHGLSFAGEETLTMV